MLNVKLFINITWGFNKKVFQGTKAIAPIPTLGTQIQEPMWQPMAINFPGTAMLYQLYLGNFNSKCCYQSSELQLAHYLQLGVYLHSASNPIKLHY